MVLVVFSLLVLAGVTTAIVFGVRWLVQEQPWQNLPFVGSSNEQPEEEPDPIPTLLPTAAPDPEADDESDEEPEPQACAPADLKLEALTDKSDYAAGETPALSIRLTNLAEMDCIVNVGTTQQVFTVTSGPDTWWRSTDCQAEPEDAWVTLEAGQVVETSEPVTWNRQRSTPETCDADERPGATAGTYVLEVAIGEAHSEPASFILR
nr:hypothetical protein [Microbacterium amylolyticum]